MDLLELYLKQTKEFILPKKVTLSEIQKLETLNWKRYGPVSALYKHISTLVECDEGHTYRAVVQFQQDPNLPDTYFLVKPIPFMFFTMKENKNTNKLMTNDLICGEGFVSAFDYQDKGIPNAVISNVLNKIIKDLSK